MACQQEYFVGQGNVYFRTRIAGCDGDFDGGLIPFGDADELTIAHSTTWGDHYESQTGLRSKAARWLTQQDASFTLRVQNINATNLAIALLGTDSGEISGASISGEVITRAYAGEIVPLKYPGISAVTVQVTAQPVGAGLTLPDTLTVDVDYIIDADNGTIKLLNTGSSVFVGKPAGPYTLSVNYTHADVKGVVEALSQRVAEYGLWFEGKNMTNADEVVTVRIDRVQIEPTDQISWIGTGVANLTLKGTILPIDGKFYTVTKGSVAP